MTFINRGKSTPADRSKSLPIGIATLHYGYNEGAILQAHALAQLLSPRIPEKSIRVIDQRYPGKRRVYEREQNARTRELSKAIDHWLPLSDEQTALSTYRDVRDLLNRTYSAVVVGSDVVWSLRYHRRLRRFTGRGILPRQTDPFFPAFPNIYWPGADVTIPKMSFAASVGTLQFDDVPARHMRAMRKTLQAFDSISVRDQRTLDFVERLDHQLAQRVVLMPDPTLATDVLDSSIDDQLVSKLHEFGVDFERPRVGVISPDHPAVHESMMRLKAEGVQIIGITTPNSFSDVGLFDVGLHPLEWARLFHFMDACVVERMHAAIFCLLNRTPFVIIDQYVTQGEAHTKVSSLMRDFGLLSHRLRKSQVTASQLDSAIAHVRDVRWDWQAIHEKIADGRNRAVAFVEAFRAMIRAG